ncbi:serine hydroxymethyltransferase [Candidatus Daviesbacteria bacterium]|nr:serine hydroxymethyltransferase [Candidatus Daviesbacteria bacterium]
MERFQQLQEELIEGARIQDEYDLSTINLIAPASPTPLKYFYDLPLRHNAIAEGLLGHRPYAGVEGFNRIERIAVEAACLLFGAEHANVQPHSVSQANQAVYQALLDNGDRVLAMRFQDGGHLSHGLRFNFSGRFFDFNFYGVDRTTGLIDYDALEEKAVTFNPKLIVCGASSYPRAIDFERLAAISTKVGSCLMADLSHPAGLIVANRFPKPFPYCNVVTFTPDKTMLGPHGGIILCKNDLSEQIDKAVHPGVQSSVPLRRIYQMAQCLIDASKPEFTDYIDRVIKNMKAFEAEFGRIPNIMITGGSDTHLMVIDTKNTFGLTGKQSEELLETLDILTNRQVIPGETLKPYVASGVRLGTSWITARGYNEVEAKEIAEIILDNLSDPANLVVQARSKEAVNNLLKIKRADDVWYEES